MAIDTYNAPITSKHSPKLQIFAACIFIVIAEAVTLFVDPVYGFSLHSLIIISLMILYSLKHWENPSSKLYLGLSLIPLIRIISLSMPRSYFPINTGYAVVNILVLVAMVAMMGVRGIGFNDAGIVFKKPIEWAAIVFTGISIGFIDYFILRPEPLSASAAESTLGAMSTILLLFLLASKEMVTADTRQPLQDFGRALTIGILPLLISFALVVSFKILEVL